jgi:hypothetical protein
MNASSKKMISISNKLSTTSRRSVLTASPGTSPRKLTATAATTTTTATTATSSMWPATVKAVIAIKKETQQLNSSADTATNGNNSNTNSHRYSAVGSVSSNSGRRTPLSSPPTSPTASGSPTAAVTSSSAVTTAAAALPSTLNTGIISTIDEITTFPFKSMYSSAKIHAASPADSDEMACRDITSTSDSVP